MKRYKFIPTLILLFSVVTMLLNTLSQNILAEMKEREAPVQGGIYRRPIEFIPGKLDPAFSTDIYGVMIIQQVFDSLVQFDKDLNVIPAIARSWKVSPDGLTYTFYLREGVRFHNGREVTADDFIYSFTRIIDPKNKAPAAYLLEKISGFKEFQDGKANYVKGLKSTDKFTFEIKLIEPFYPFLSALGINHFKVIPREEIEKKTPDFIKVPIGTGPFKFVSMKEGEEIVLEANPDYFEGRPFLDKIIFKIYHGAPREKIFIDFKKGRLEESFIPPKEIEEILKQRQYPFVQKPLLSLRFYGFHLQTKPLDDKKFRKAVNLAIDKKFIISELHKNQFNLARGILPPGMPGYDPKREPYPYNESLARKYLMESGYRKEKSTIQIWSASKSEAAQKELNEIKSQLNKIGIETNIQYETNWPNFISMLNNYKAPVFIYAWYADFPDPDNFLGTLFHSKSKYNYTNYYNPEVDRLLDRARAERDYLKRMEMYRKIEEMILDDAPVVPMVNHLFQMVYQPHVRGVEVSALGGPYVPMKKIWLKK